VALDYHVDVHRHYYSVPHQLLRQQVWVRVTARTIEVFAKGQRASVACKDLVQSSAHHFA